MHIKGKCAIFYLNGGGAIFFNSAVFGDPLLEPGRSFLIRVTDILFWAPKRKVGLQSYSTNTGTGIIDNRKPTGINL